MEQEDKAKSFSIGQHIDIRDSKNKWVDGQIVSIKGRQAYVHYSGWSSRYDQFIDLRSDRVLSQWEPSKPLRINNRVDAYHPSGGWLEARVIDIELDHQSQIIVQVKVHYFNYHPKYDRWIPFDDNSQISIIGSRSKASGIGKSRLHKKSQGMTLSQLVKKMLEIKVQKMIEELKAEDYVVKDIGGDGNCLFRSVSDQLYGTQNYHKEIRRLCLQYIKDERVFFQDYVTEDLHQYVERKSQDGVWGDDVEIEAISEIYGRPIEIYSTSASTPLRTFHEDNQNKIEPLRLAYVGFCHYNSIKKRNEVQKGILETPFGEYESIFSAAYTTKGVNYYLDINRFRQTFSNSNPIDYALQENVQASERKEDAVVENVYEFDNKEISRAIKESETENILEQIEKSEIEQVNTKIEQEQLQEELRRIEEREMQIAKQMSKKVKKDPEMQRPYWFQDLVSQGFGEKEILFAIEINGYDPDLVQNFLLDNM